MEPDTTTDSQRPPRRRRSALPWFLLLALLALRRTVMASAGSADRITSRAAPLPNASHAGPESARSAAIARCEGASSMRS